MNEIITSTNGEVRKRRWKEGTKEEGGERDREGRKVIKYATQEEFSVRNSTLINIISCRRPEKESLQLICNILSSSK
jgi:hypothetical protein